VIYDYLVKELNSSRGTAKLISRFALGRPALALKYFEDQELVKKKIAKAKLFLDLFFSGRSTGVNELMLGLRSQSVAEAKELLDLWEGVARDLYLAYYNQGSLTRNELIDDSVFAQVNNFKVEIFPKIFSQLGQAKKYIAANVNPGLVVENFCYNIIK
jgi:hypothetical protein